MSFSSSNPMFDDLLELSQRDDSSKWSNIEFGKEMTQVESIKVNFTLLILSSGYACCNIHILYKNTKILMDNLNNL